MNLVNHELCMYLAKFSLAIFTDTPKMYLADEPTSLFTKFFFANSFHLYGFANNFPTKYFSCTVYVYMEESILRFSNASYDVMYQC